MSGPNPLLPGERANKHGLLIVTIAQLALLHGLLDRPEGKAASYRDWARASMPYLVRLKAYPRFRGLLLCIHRVPPTLVTTTRIGRRIECQLTARGRSVLDLELPAYVWSHGPYYGLRRLTGR